MASVLKKLTLEFIPSVNTPDYPEKDFIINPDMSQVEGVKREYWKLEDNRVVSASEVEKGIIDSVLTADIEEKQPPCPYGLREKCEYCNG